MAAVVCVPVGIGIGIWVGAGGVVGPSRKGPPVVGRGPVVWVSISNDDGSGQFCWADVAPPDGAVRYVDDGAIVCGWPGGDSTLRSRQATSISADAARARRLIASGASRLNPIERTSELLAAYLVRPIRFSAAPRPIGTSTGLLECSRHFPRAQGFVTFDVYTNNLGQAPADRIIERVVIDGHRLGTAFVLPTPRNAFGELAGAFSRELHKCSRQTRFVVFSRTISRVPCPQTGSNAAGAQR